VRKPAWHGHPQEFLERKKARQPRLDVHNRAWQMSSPHLDRHLGLRTTCVGGLLSLDDSG